MRKVLRLRILSKSMSSMMASTCAYVAAWFSGVPSNADAPVPAFTALQRAACGAASPAAAPP